jgi:hypothetical protein
VWITLHTTIASETLYFCDISGLLWLLMSGPQEGLPTPGDLVVDSTQISELRESKDKLLQRVKTLKTELTDWRSKLDEQMMTYRTELGDLRTHLNTEVSGLREQFSELQGTIHAQLEVTSRLADSEGSAVAKRAAAGKLGHGSQ